MRIHPDRLHPDEVTPMRVTMMYWHALLCTPFLSLSHTHTDITSSWLQRLNRGIACLRMEKGAEVLAGVKCSTARTIHTSVEYTTQRLSGWVVVLRKLGRENKQPEKTPSGVAGCISP